MTENPQAAHDTLEQSLNCSYRTFFAGIFPIALATLQFEVSLIRGFSYTIWHELGFAALLLGRRSPAAATPPA